MGSDTNAFRSPYIPTGPRERALTLAGKEAEVLWGKSHEIDPQDGTKQGKGAETGTTGTNDPSVRLKMNKLINRRFRDVKRQHFASVSAASGGPVKAAAASAASRRGSVGDEPLDTKALSMSQVLVNDAWLQHRFGPVSLTDTCGVYEGPAPCQGGHERVCLLENGRWTRSMMCNVEGSKYIYRESKGVYTAQRVMSKKSGAGTERVELRMFCNEEMRKDVDEDADLEDLDDGGGPGLADGGEDDEDEDIEDDGVRTSALPQLVEPVASSPKAKDSLNDVERVVRHRVPVRVFPASELVPRTEGHGRERHGYDIVFDRPHGIVQLKRMSKPKKT